MQDACLDDPAMLLIRLHGMALRACSRHMGTHFEGLQVASRKMHKKKVITTKLCRQLCALDNTVAWVRHVTGARCQGLMAQLGAELASHTEGTDGAADLVLADAPNHRSEKLVCEPVASKPAQSAKEAAVVTAATTAPAAAATAAAGAGLTSQATAKLFFTVGTDCDNSLETSKAYEEELSAKEAAAATAATTAPAAAAAATAAATARSSSSCSRAPEIRPSSRPCIKALADQGIPAAAIASLMDMDEATVSAVMAQTTAATTAAPKWK